MEDILAGLGVQVEEEKDAKSNVIREKVMSQLLLDVNPLVTPVLPTSAFPKLSLQSINLMAADLQQDVNQAAQGNDDQKFVLANMKLRFFRVMMNGRSGSTNSEEAKAASMVMSSHRLKTSGAIKMTQSDEQGAAQHIINSGSGQWGNFKRFSSEPFVVRSQLGPQHLPDIDDAALESLQAEASGQRQQNTVAALQLEEGQMLDEFQVEDEEEVEVDMDLGGDGAEEGQEGRVKSTAAAEEGPSAAELADFERKIAQRIAAESESKRLDLLFDQWDAEEAAGAASSSSVGQEKAEEPRQAGTSSSSSSLAAVVVKAVGAAAPVERKDIRKAKVLAGAQARTISSSSSNSIRKKQTSTVSAALPAKRPREPLPKAQIKQRKAAMVQCPLCNDQLEYKPRSRAAAATSDTSGMDAFLAEHMSTCTGRPRRQSHAATMANVRSATHALQTGFYFDPEAPASPIQEREEEEEYECEDDDEEEEEAELAFSTLEKDQASRGKGKKRTLHQTEKLVRAACSSSSRREGPAMDWTRDTDDVAGNGDDGEGHDLDLAGGNIFADERDQDAAAAGASGAAGSAQDWCVTAVKTEVLDDWEDHLYTNRLREAGIEHTNDEEIVETSYGAKAPAAVWNLLHEYQKEGCSWMWGLNRQGIGGILGDEMGLGKTVQLCVHLNSLSMQKRQNTNGRDAGIFLVVCPATVLHHWLKELHRWVPSMRALIVHAISKTGQEIMSIGEAGGQDALDLALRRLRKDSRTRGLVCIVTYDGLRRFKKTAMLIEWTAVCLDEGQKIRNPDSAVTQVCKALPAFHRLILSGTPIQNNLIELWSLIDFCYPGRLGTQMAFDQEFATPIRNGGYAGSSHIKVEIAVRIATTLQRIVKPLLLRRRKDDASLGTALPAKVEQVLFCKLSSRQREIYRDILNSPEVEQVLQKKSMAFRAITTLRKLCNHPALVYKNGKVLWHDETKEETRARLREEQKRKDKRKEKQAKINAQHRAGQYARLYAPPRLAENADGDADENEDEDATELIADDEDDEKVELTGGLTWHDSGKLLVLSKVLPLWRTEGHKVLLFTQTQGMLNMIELMMREFNFKYLRLDGSTAVGRREGLIQTFNEDPEVFVMIMTTRTGGVGISLTAANRVVLVDPDWNPQTDVQARERAWRLGQKRDVTIYRLITRGTIEEKIYQRQIFKILLSNRILDNPNQKAFFSKTDIRDLFELGDEHGGRESMPVGSAVTLASAPLQQQREIEEGEEKEEKEMRQAYLAVAGEEEEEEEEEEEVGDPYDAGQDRRPRRRQNTPDASAFTADDFEVAPYVEEELPEHLRETSSSKTPEDAAAERDKRLLKVLYDGSAISSVHDHSFLEPGVRKHHLSTWERERVNQGHSQAVRALTSSARSYDADASATEHVSGASSNSRFRSVRGGGLAGGGKFGQFSMTNSAAASSSTILASLRERNGSASSSSASSSFQSPALYGPAHGQAITAVPSAAPISLEEGIERRLHALFDRAARSQSLSIQQSGLSTEFVLSQFKDVGDQYAPVFRETLRKVANFRNNMWSKKE